MQISTREDELERLGDDIAALSAQVDGAICRLLALIREFDERRGWHAGFRSCADWLAWRIGLDLGAARERVRVARALGRLPRLATALEHGELSYAKVRALTRVATPETEARLLAVGRTSTASNVERIVRGWRQADRLAEARDARRRHASRALRVHQDETGMVVIPRPPRSGDRRGLHARARGGQGRPVPPIREARLGRTRPAERANVRAAERGRAGPACRVSPQSRDEPWRPWGAPSGRPARPGRPSGPGGRHARFRGTRHVARATSHPQETEYDRVRRARGR